MLLIQVTDAPSAATNPPPSIAFLETNRLALEPGEKCRLRGRRPLQASAIGFQWPGWCRQRRRRPGHRPVRGNANKEFSRRAVGLAGMLKPSRTFDHTCYRSAAMAVRFSCLLLPTLLGLTQVFPNEVPDDSKYKTRIVPGWFLKFMDSLVPDSNGFTEQSDVISGNEPRVS